MKMKEQDYKEAVKYYELVGATRAWINILREAEERLATSDPVAFIAKVGSIRGQMEDRVKLHTEWLALLKEEENHALALKVQAITGKKKKVN